MTSFAFMLGANPVMAGKRLARRPRRLYTSRDVDLRRALGVLLGPPIVARDAVGTLLEGGRIFPPMLEATRAARVSITFETFIFRDEIACEFLLGAGGAAQAEALSSSS